MRTRNNMLKVMLNDEELEQLNKQMKISGLNKSALLRKLIKGLKINPAPTDEYRKMCSLISNAANNLNQIARQANTSVYVNEDKLDTAIVLIRKCWQLMRELR